MMLLNLSQIFAQSTKLLSPSDFLPHRLGEQFTPHNWLVDYYHHVAALVPERMQLREYGRTNEGRPLLFAAISTPQNIKNLEQIRLNNLRRTGLLTDKPADKNNTIAILWISMNVHGNEPASSETSMALLHRLVSGEDKNVEEWLKNTVVLVDPCLNPDGYHRYTFWHNGVANRSPNIAPEAREHQEPWPYGRSNHYLFDLNRDWAWATQTETKARLEMYHQWMPQVHPDFHEMSYNNPYYFAPAAQPYHNYITPFNANFSAK
jgi:murein tripeptide amidase MpaA